MQADSGHRAPTRAASIQVLTSRNAPLACMLTAKAGCVFLRSLFYLIDTGEVHGNPLSIHDEPTLTYASLSPDELAELVSFFVVRNPQDRFLSLYWDKGWDGSSGSFDWLMEHLEPLGFIRGSELTVEQHRTNCNRLLGFIERQLRNKATKAVNPHWMPQSERAHQAIQAGMTPILLEEITSELVSLAADWVPGSPAVSGCAAVRAS